MDSYPGWESKTGHKLPKSREQPDTTSGWYGNCSYFETEMDQGLSILGEQASVPESRKEAKIETFPNPGTGNDYWIELATGEFTSNCPVNQST